MTQIKEEVELPPFRTISEIEAILARGGMSETEAIALWGCVFLHPAEIADLLAIVRERASADFSFMLHAPRLHGNASRRGAPTSLAGHPIQFDQDHLIARSHKQSRRTAETKSRIDLNSALKRKLLAKRERRPSGQFVTCEPESLEFLSPDLANRAFWAPMRGTTWCLKTKKNWFKVGFHTYRDSFASNLAARGVDQKIIDEWMGHQTDAMRKRYRHLFPSDRRTAIEAFWFFKLKILAIHESKHKLAE